MNGEAGKSMCVLSDVYIVAHIGFKCVHTTHFTLVSIIYSVHQESFIMNFLVMLVCTLHPGWLRLSTAHIRSERFTSIKNAYTHTREHMCGMLTPSLGATRE